MAEVIDSRFDLEKIAVDTLIAYLKGIIFATIDGGSFTVNRFSHELPTHEDEVNTPSISITAGQSVFDGELFPRILEDTYDDAKKTVLVKNSDVTIPLQIDCLASLPVQRSEMMRTIERALAGPGIETRGLILDAIGYHGRKIVYIFDSAIMSFETEQGAEVGERRAVLIGEAYIEHIEERSIRRAIIEVPRTIVEEFTI